MRTFALCLVSLLAGCSCGDDSGDTTGGPDGAGGASWERLTDLWGGPVQETALVEIDRLLYLLGGIDDEQETLARVMVYHPDGDSWERGPDLPTAVHHVNAAVVDGTIYVVGSLAPNFEPMAQVWSWTPGEAEWSTDHAPMPAPARGAAVVGVVGGSIVVAGGSSDAGSSTAVAIYDPVADEWDESADPLPIPLDHATGQVVDGTLYVIGGRSNGIVAVSPEVFRFDDGTWSARAPMPTARGGTASGVVDGRIVVVGGEGNRDADSGVFPQAEMYDPAADEWSSLADMPNPRHGMAAAGVGNSLYVPGGADTQGFGAVATHEVLHLE